MYYTYRKNVYMYDTYRKISNRCAASCALCSDRYRRPAASHTSSTTSSEESTYIETDYPYVKSVSMRVMFASECASLLKLQEWLALLQTCRKLAMSAFRQKTDCFKNRDAAFLWMTSNYLRTFYSAVEVFCSCDNRGVIIERRPIPITDVIANALE